MGKIWKTWTPYGKIGKTGTPYGVDRPSHNLYYENDCSATG